MNDSKKDQKFEILLDYLKHSRGFDFTGYKRASLMRRVSKRMQIVGLEDFGDYLDHLKMHPAEFTLLFNTILINVTAFFRDAPAWNYLAQEVIPQIIAARTADDPIRVWSAGCASGEEACTLAILLAEALGIEKFRQKVKLYATDVDEEALALARQASYRPEALEPVPARLRDKYFEARDDRHVFRTDLRGAIIFGRHDLAHDAPLSHLDLLVCRNTLMYFKAETQSRILTRLHLALKENGFLFLGRAEMLLTCANLFAPLDLKHRVFTRVPAANRGDRLLVPTPAGEEDRQKPSGPPFFCQTS